MDEYINTTDQIKVILALYVNQWYLCAMLRRYQYCIENTYWRAIYNIRNHFVCARLIILNNSL